MKIVISKKKQKGASMVEYAILVAILVGVAIAALNAFSPKLIEAFTAVGNKVVNAAK